MKNIATLTLSVLILPICLLAGLSAPAFAMLICLSIILEGYYYISLQSLRMTLFSHYPVITFLIWMVISCLWSPIPGAALGVAGKIITFFMLTMLTIQIIYSDKRYAEVYNPKKENFYHGLKSYSPLNLLTYGLIIATGIYWVEWYSNGNFHQFYSSMLSKAGTDFTFYLFKLDRGCAIISLISWVVIGYFISSKKHILAALTYISTLALLFTSDSLASLVAYICSLTSYILMLLTRGKILSFIKYTLFLGAITFVILIYRINPENFINNIPALPDSAKHRIYIWNYVVKFFLEHKYIGFGLESSRYISNTFADYVLHKEASWSLLPLHPHNNILQILLELGITGALLAAYMIVHIFAKIKELDNTYLQAVGLSIFIQYFIIGMISYSIWQQWWIATAAMTYLFWSILLRAKE
jgi:O-antigen ligase